MQMFGALWHGLLIFSLVLSVSAIDIGFGHCICDDDHLWSAERVFRCQKVGDSLIAAAYFSIPLELLYFATCSDLFPFKWIVLQFSAFIVLCGLTHLLAVFTYGPHSFLLMLSLTISKFLTALVSFATSITLLTLIPQLLRVKVRENFLRIKARELDREVLLMKRQEEASWHVRMLTQEIRKSLDRHTILYTTMVELSKTLGLQNCAVWMPDESQKEMVLTHQLKERMPSELHRHSVPIDEMEVLEIKETKGVKKLSSGSVLGSASSGDMLQPGAVAAIRMPLLNASNFKGGTPEIMQANYAILVLVLPQDDTRLWSTQELEIIEVVADQVAVALSHAAVLEESQLMREKLVERKRVLLQARQEAMRASEARNTFQRAMCEGMRTPMHSILGLLSMMQRDKLSPDQSLVVNTIVKTSSVVSTLINDVMEASTTNCERLSLVMRPFELRSMINEAVGVARCLCDSKGITFRFQVESTLPERLTGDEKRVFHVILHMLGTLVNRCDEGSLTFSALSYNEVEGRQNEEWWPWKSNLSDGYICLKFEFGIKRLQTNNISTSSSPQVGWRPDSEGLETGLSFSICKKLVQMMNGNIWGSSDSTGLAESITLVLQFKLQPRTPVSGEASDFYHASLTPNFQGLRVVLADPNDTNRTVTRKLLEKLGCRVLPVSSAVQCLSSLSTTGTPFQLVILDLNMHEMDGFEVAAWIRKPRSGPLPFIVALTASAEANIWERCVQLGINGLIRKPVTLAALGDELYRVLEGSY